MLTLAMPIQADSRICRPMLSVAMECLGSSNESYWELFVILGMLRTLYLTHQTHHWTASGDPFYGDHLLFQKLYELNLEQIDSVAEKSVGLGSTNLVNLTGQLQLVSALQECLQKPFAMPHPNQLIETSLVAETTFLHFMRHACASLKETGLMTHGLDNLLAGIEDSHEGSVYLLKQRATTAFMP